MLIFFDDVLLCFEEGSGDWGWWWQSRVVEVFG
jgi:hypothetical protein